MVKGITTCVHVTNTMLTEEVIKHDKNDRDAWTCVCGNELGSDGFYPCDSHGNEIEPTAGWAGLYVCFRCGRIIEQNTLRVVGRNPHPKLMA
jgi:hypothetical protein